MDFQQVQKLRQLKQPLLKLDQLLRFPLKLRQTLLKSLASPEAPTPTVVVLSGDDTTPSALTTEQATKYLLTADLIKYCI